ncbi:leucine-rich repeat neuronal protein 1-like [Amphibalanus amphitrite]|uniref:leucine-rich repeat neuronal protein 1-like n=1 Tax=Amphibalanus amphitrite TaxID=1232801 RepID=UPI001C9229D7|nr:leucine-rich repeat neuronal protein 1-like [Amphibalanus amphitrite]
MAGLASSDPEANEEFNMFSPLFSPTQHKVTERRPPALPLWALLVTSGAALVASADTSSDICPEKCSCSEQTPRAVSCRGRSLVEPPDGLPPDTAVLDISSNRLAGGLAELGRLTALRELRLDDNRLPAVPRGAPLRLLSQLRLLSMTRNGIRTMYEDAFRGLVSLEELSLATNKIGHIEDEAFSELQSLRTLNLSGNQLTTVSPAWFRQLANVTTLDLSGNRLRHMPVGVLGGMAALRRLLLAENHITSLHTASLLGPRNLSSLDLRGNQLTAAPSAALRRAAHLDTVRLSDNPFAKLPAASFAGLSVRELDLSSLPRLQIIDSGAFVNLSRLVELRLNGSGALRYVAPRFVHGAPALRRLLLHDTGLLSLAAELAEELAAPLQLSLYGAPLRCDCVLAWLPTALASGSVTLAQPEGTLCKTPEQLRGRRLDAVPAATLGDTCGPTLVPLGRSTVRRDTGQRLTLECRATGRPAPRLSWRSPRQNTSRSGGSLLLRHVTEADAGRYWCVAESSRGTANRSVTVRVQEVDIHLFPTGVSSKFVTLVWNGTARNNFPRYQLMYGRAGEDESDYESRIVTPFHRSYTIGGLQPSTSYQFCLSYPDRDSRPVRISCTDVRTRDAAFMTRGIRREWTAAAAAAAGVAALVLAGLTLLAVAARRYRSRLREENDKDTGSQIPLESFYSPLLSQSSPS